jgi:hypothetical protein
LGERDILELEEQHRLLKLNGLQKARKAIVPAGCDFILNVAEDMKRELEGRDRDWRLDYLGMRTRGRGGPTETPGSKLGFALDKRERAYVVQKIWRRQQGREGSLEGLGYQRQHGKYRPRWESLLDNFILWVETFLQSSTSGKRRSILILYEEMTGRTVPLGMILRYERSRQTGA